MISPVEGIVANRQFFKSVTPPERPQIGVRIRRYTAENAATTLLDTSYTTDIPANTVFLTRHFQVRNGTTAAATSVDLMRMYTQSDF